MLSEDCARMLKEKYGIDVAPEDLVECCDCGCDDEDEDGEEYDFDEDELEDLLGRDWEEDREQVMQWFEAMPLSELSGFLEELTGRLGLAPVHAQITLVPGPAPRKKHRCRCEDEE